MTANVPLSKREQEVLKLVLQGKSNKQIAVSLGITVRTVEFHLKNIYAKSEVSSRIQLVLKLESATAAARIKELGYSTVDRAGKTPKMEASPARKWIGPHSGMLSPSSARS